MSIKEKLEGEQFLVSDSEEVAVKAAVADHISHTGDGAKSEWFEIPKQLGRGLWSLKVPVCLLALITFAPKLIVLWVLFVVAKPIALWTRDHLPSPIAERFKSRFGSSLIREIDEGSNQALPFVLFAIYMCCAPFALAWMLVHWARGFVSNEKTVAATTGGEQLVFKQNKRVAKEESENNFYHSKAFGITFLAFFILGIPAWFSYQVYERTGMSQVLETTRATVAPLLDAPMGPPNIKRPRIGYISAPINDEDVTLIAGYNGYWPSLTSGYRSKLNGAAPPPSPPLKRSSVVFLHFYLMSVAIALSILFFRTWFTFPLNFLSDEHDVLVTADGVRRRGFNGWFLSVLTFNRFAIGGGPDALRWDEIKSLRKLEEGFTKLYPLPETAFKKESLTYKCLNKIAALIDGFSCRSNASKYLVFSSTVSGSDFRRNIPVNLNELSREQRAKLFYAVKKWAPHVVINEAAEEQLLGSCVLRDNRYTKLWFDMLTTKIRRKPKNVLEQGDVLRGGEYVIESFISSGGQASAYCARKANGELCVLKEFILSTSADSGALIDSARDFESEVSLLCQLQHPGIVKLEDYFFEDGRVYIALDYIRGQSLRKRVQEHGALDEAEVIKIGIAMCEVLEYLHSCNPPIVHRDVTPENILLDESGGVKLIDFSLAVKQDGKRTTDSCAKQCFTPPEQFREEACVQSDIYALGATMYYLLTGSVPKPITQSSPRDKAPHVSDGLDDIIRRATELDFNRRYESAYWMRLELAALAANTHSPAVIDLRQAARVE